MIGKQIKQLRTQNQVKQDELAEYLGVSYQAVSKVDEALKYWEQMVTDFPDIWQAHCSLGDGYAKLGMYDKAIEAYEKSFAMQEAPRIAEGLCSMAQVHEMRNEFEKAINDYKRLIENLKDDYGVTDGEQVDRYVREIARLKKKDKNVQVM